MRNILLAAVAAVGLAFVAVPAASAAPSYGAGVANAAPSMDLQQARWWRYHHHHCWWRHGVRFCD
jgi:hypothetical protein